LGVCRRFWLLTHRGRQASAARGWHRRGAAHRPCCFVCRSRWRRGASSALARLRTHAARLACWRTFSNPLRSPAPTIRLTSAFPNS